MLECQTFKVITFETSDPGQKECKKDGDIGVILSRFTDISPRIILSPRYERAPR